MTSARIPTAARDLFVLGLILGVVYFVSCGLRPLSNPDEGRYVEIAREMASSSDYISPRLNGVLYFEKPPLFYWLEAGAVSAGGMNLWALRFWPCALALLGCAAIYGTGRTLWGRHAGWWSAWALGTGLLYFGVGQVIILDMAVSVFITWSLCAFMLAVRAPPGPRRWRWCGALYFSMTLALLTKGLIGLVIPGAIIFLWLALLGKWRELRHAHILTGIVILLIFGLPWHVAAAIAHPPPGGWNWAHFFSKDWHDQGFLWYYFVHEHVLRYIDPSTANRVEPWWFFSALLLVGFFPWVAFLPQALAGACKGGWARFKAEPEILFLLLWTLFPLVFFSISSSKLPPYILPSVPPLALLTGRWIARALSQPNAAPLVAPLRVLTLVSLALTLILPFLPHILPDQIPAAATGKFFVLAALFMYLTIIGFGATMRARPNPMLALCALVTTLCAVLFLLNPTLSPILDNRRPSTAPAADWLRPRLHPADQVFVLDDYGPYQDFAPLLGRTIGLAANIPDEQEFGLMLETNQLADRYPGLANYLAVRKTPHPTAAQINNALVPPFLDLLHAPARVYVLVAAPHFAEFVQAHPDTPVHSLWHDDHFVIFSNLP